MLLSLLEKMPPPNEAAGQQWFDVLVECILNFTQLQLSILLKLQIYYLDGGTNREFHSKLFIFVDFGPAMNMFLSAYGSKSEPSINEVVEILISDPQRFYKLSGGFLAELQNLAVNSYNITNGPMSKMKISLILLGICCQKALKTLLNKTSLAEWDEEGWENLHNLQKPSEIIIADNMNAYQLFGNSVFITPQEDLLEGA
ncbi:hypothetical protein J3R83DRAFT_11798 [Lanmaoa asiatica]|nr:hypothetical protein J3R83DRAFT_11798 [Lanmaoa asiatica]